MLETPPINQVLHEVFDHRIACDEDGAHVPLPDGDDSWRTMIHLAGHL
jgi:hypothetical protein